jgi:uncharacterized Zn finger protein (UPF0148 family)
MRQAKISCPHCGGSITVREKDAKDFDPENVEKIWAAADEMFKAMDAGFRKVFHPSLWRRSRT